MPALMQFALLSGAALCLALLLNRGVNNNNNNQDNNKAQGSGGQFPPMLHRKSSPEPVRGGSGGSGGQFSRSHTPEAIARAKGSSGAGGKSNLAGQIIPVYGFGILLYILYIIFKITSKGKTSKPHENRIPAVRSENKKRKITDFELTQLQERLKETEEVMERIVSRAQSPDSVGPVHADQEEVLLLQLREITRVMQEGRLLEGFSPQQDPTDTHYQHQDQDQDQPDDPDQTDYPEWHQHCCGHHHHHHHHHQNEEMDGEMDEGMNEQMNEEMDGEMDSHMDIQTDREMDRQVDGEMDRQMERQVDGEMDRQMERQMNDDRKERQVESVLQDFDEDHVYSEEEAVAAGCDEDEELTGEMMMMMTKENKTLHKLWKPSSSSSSSSSGDGLIRRKIKAVGVTE